MNAHFKIAVTALCWLLLGLPAAQAGEKFFYTTNLHVELDTSEDGVLRALPKDLQLKAGEYYRLELVNFSPEQRHVMMAPEFGDAILMTGIRTYPHVSQSQARALARESTWRPARGWRYISRPPRKDATSSSARTEATPWAEWKWR